MTNYNSANVEVFRHRGFTVKYSSTMQDYRVYAGDSLIGVVFTWQRVNQVIDIEMKLRRAVAPKAVRS